MTRQQFATKIRTNCKQTSSSLTDAQILAIANPIKDDLAELISSYDIKGNYFIVPALDNLIALQREYAFPDDMLNHMFSLEVAFSNTTDSFGQLQYVQCFPDDFRRLGLARTEANIQANYTNGNTGSIVVDSLGSTLAKVAGPRYEIQRRSIYLLSGAIDATTLGSSSITNGIRLRYRVYPADLPDVTDNTVDMSVDPSTTTFGFPRQFHELWARACSIEWKGQHPGAVPLSAKEQSYETDLAEKLEGIQINDMGDEIIGRIDYDDGYEY